MGINLPSGVGRVLGGKSAAASAGEGKFVLIPLTGGPTIIFQFFPTAPIVVSRRADWPEQEVTIGTKPLFYMNRDPRKLEVGEIWMDKTDIDVSLTPDIEQLLSLQNEQADGTPPKILAMWGDRTETCVLEEVRVEESFHNPSGEPIRVKVSLVLKEHQLGSQSRAAASTIALG